MVVREINQNPTPVKWQYVKTQFVFRKWFFVDPKPGRRNRDFIDVKYQMDDIKKYEEQFRRWMNEKCSWQDKEDKQEYLKDRRQRVRRNILNRHVPDRKCPKCGRLVINNRSWVISLKESKSMSIVWCRSCYFQMLEYLKMEEPEGLDMNPADIFEPVSRYKINGEMLAEYRIKTGLSQHDFATIAKWSRAYQSKLEGDTFETVSELKRQQILFVFAKGKEILSSIGKVENIEDVVK